MVGVYVDDIITTGDTENVKLFRERLHSELGMDDGSEFNWYLDIDTNRHPVGTYEIHQPQYIDDKCVEIRKFIGQGGSSTPLPLDYQHIRAVDTIRAKIYSGMVGSLMYAMICTRADLPMALSVVCRFMKQPKEEDCDLVQHLFHYVSRNRYLLTSKRSAPQFLAGFAGVSYNNQDEGKSTLGYLLTVGDSLISWNSIRQPVMVLSKCEAELISANSATQEANWLKLLHQDIGYEE